ncbi:MAG TPA: MBL fold metallo-hydrolase [Syntrophales bacterium]|nr:MBL fold metallo-hydrolase [Syntrophales bacterium]HPQ45158.1 MBL fold metallo-hydrolase [Syntrophales bacterium]
MIHHIEGGYANTYLIEGRYGLAAVDVGSNLAAEIIQEIINEQYGGGKGALKLITATHFHIDHLGGIAKLKDLFPETEINFFSMVARYISGEERLAIPPFSRWVMGLVPVVSRIPNQYRNYRQSFASVKAGIPLPFLRTFTRIGYEPKCELEESLDIPFLPDWRLIETPGHTPDSVCFYNSKQRTLISGDTILNMEGTGEVNRFCCSVTDIVHSFEKLSSLDIETIYPGHGAPIAGVQSPMANVKVIDSKGEKS